MEAIEKKKKSLHSSFEKIKILGESANQQPPTYKHLLYQFSYGTLLFRHIRNDLFLQ